MGKELYVGTFVHSLSLNQLEIGENGVIGVEDGQIAFVEKNVKDLEAIKKAHNFEGAKTTQLSGCQFLIPGFIDCHIHASQYPNAGIGRDLPLLDWLQKYTFPLESSFKDSAKAKQVYTKCVQRTLAQGTTTASYYGTIHVDATNILADICLDIGQRAFIGKVCMNQLSPDYYRDETADQSMTNTQASIDYIRKIDPHYSLVCPIITPRFAPSCTPDLLTRLGKLAKDENLPIQTHMSENLAEVALVKEMFPGHASYAAVYDAHGLFTDRTIVAHCVHISADEVKLCAEKGVGIAHCPISNTGLTSGEAKVRWMIEGGVKVGLGTDCSGGYSPSILESARQASNVSRHVCMKSTVETKETPQLALAEILYLATMGGAQVCALQDKVGNFVVGKEFDALLIDPGVKGGNVDIFEEDAHDWDRVLSKWAFNGDDRNIQKVWVQGRLVAGQAV